MLEYRETGRMSCESLRAFCPVAPACREDFHVPLEIVHRSESIWVTHEDLEYSYLKIHTQTGSAALLTKSSQNATLDALPRIVRGRAGIARFLTE
ncbi:hypothetical protein AC629_21570 [Bradyrhizobium sp. NAS80.1]|nr:hypothetical protein AC629_21570 [Bradyrhizobium sp. NAS80.1]